MDTIQEPSVKVAQDRFLRLGWLPVKMYGTFLIRPSNCPSRKIRKTWTQVGQDGSGLVFLQRECCRRSWLIVVFSSVQLIEGRIPMQARAIHQFWALEGYLGKRIQLELGAGHRGMKCCIASSAYRTVNNYSGQPLATFLYL